MIVDVRAWKALPGHPALGYRFIPCQARGNLTPRVPGDQARDICFEYQTHPGMVGINVAPILWGCVATPVITSGSCTHRAAGDAGKGSCCDEDAGYS